MIFVNFTDFNKYVGDKVYDILDNPKNGFILTKAGYFREGNSKILGVAHLDTVLEHNFVFQTDKFILSPQLDDRIGIFTLMELFPEFDILLTFDEEKMSSTGIFFEPIKEYNWIVEFDRSGGVVALYQYISDKNWRRAVRKHFKIDYGAYTDICDVNIGVCGLNVPVGYYNNHSVGAYLIKEEYIKNIERFNYFLVNYKNKKFPFRRMF